MKIQLKPALQSGKEEGCLLHHMRPGGRGQTPQLPSLLKRTRKSSVFQGHCEDKCGSTCKSAENSAGHRDPQIAVIKLAILPHCSGGWNWGDRKVMREKRTSEREGESRGSQPVLNVGFYATASLQNKRTNIHTDSFCSRWTLGRTPQAGALQTLFCPPFAGSRRRWWRRAFLP